MSSTMMLKNIPKDVKQYIIKVQGDAKVKKGIFQYSQQLTIYQLIREHKEFMIALRERK